MVIWPDQVIALIVSSPFQSSSLIFPSLLSQQGRTTAGESRVSGPARRRALPVQALAGAAQGARRAQAARCSLRGEIVPWRPLRGPGRVLKLDLTGEQEASAQGAIPGSGGL